MYIRFYFRGQIIKTLADNGIQVHLLGNGWEKLDCVRKENLIQKGYVDSLTCIEYMQNSKISLNIMPWFKAGAHDRIFNAMLNGSICLSDESTYLNELFTEEDEICLYSLECMNELPDLVKNILQNPEKAKKTAKEGFSAAKNCHTWKDRAFFIERQFSSLSI